MEHNGNYGYGNKPGFDKSKNSSLLKTGQLAIGTKKPFEMGSSNNNNQFSKMPGTGGERTASRGQKNISSNMKFNDQDINEAKESLKLLKQKVNTNTTVTNNGMNNMNKFAGLSNNLGGLNNNVNLNVPNTSHNYRKVFKPNLNNNENEASSKITSQTTKPNNFPTKGQFPSNNNNDLMKNPNNGNKFNYNSSKPNLNSNYPVDNLNINKNKFNTNTNMNQPAMMKKGLNNNNNNKNFMIEEVDDDRPAFSKGAPVEPEVPEIDELTDLQECNGCGRKFKEDVYEKHAKACKKVFQSKRKAFDTKKKRIIDSEHAMILKHAEVDEKTNIKLKQVKQKKKENWKKQSEMLRNVAAANKTGADFMKKNSGNVIQIGKNQQPSTYNDDLTPCNLCGRRYNEEAYKKHLNHCEKKDKESKMKGKNATNLNARPGNTTNVNNAKPNLNTKNLKK